MSDGTDLATDEMREIIDDFLVEAEELIQSLDSNFVRLESAPDDLDLLNEIFRAAHTIKGTSSFLGFEQVTELTHKMEDVLNRLRKSELAVTPEIMDVLLESLDELKVLLENVRNENPEEIDLTDIVGKLVGIQSDQDEELPSDPVGPRSAATADVTNENEGVGSGVDSSESADKVRSAKKASRDQTIRVDVDRLDALMNLTGELVLGRNSLQQAVHVLTVDSEGSCEYDRLSRATTAINAITADLQLAVMKMRMQPVGKVFGKFPRLVRDLARDREKEIRLIISGESTELDKSVIEEIGDPLVHIIRNACDHGIELPADRVSNGKPAQGTVRLSASQEGSSIVIKIEDDGKGLDVEAIRKKAVERGLADRDEADRMPDREVFSFIFEAGLSTASVISDISGRGVGMDVVRSNIEKLNGLIELQSTLGRGTTISIKLPLTLAIVQGLLVESDEDVYILPLSSVFETVRSDQSEVHYVNQRPILRLRDEIIPLINLGDVLRSNSQGLVMTEKPYILVVGLADKKLGILIDRFLGQEEVVIKSLGQYLGSTEGIAGATILGDGRIRLIIDLLGLFSIARKIT